LLFRIDKPLEAVADHPWIAVMWALVALSVLAVAAVVGGKHYIGAGEGAEYVRATSANQPVLTLAAADTKEPTATAGRPAPREHKAHLEHKTQVRHKGHVKHGLLEDARRYGIKQPEVALSAARQAGIPFYVGAAFLMQESGGGANIFGHDTSIYSGAGKVTRQKYLQYKAQRKRSGKMQGVGPMQLTWYTFQDRADRLGGAWKPHNNMLVGFRHLANLRSAHGNWHDAARDYNGSGPAAEAYAGEVVHRMAFAKRAIGTAAAPA
jgi:hypothetical protein